MCTWLQYSGYGVFYSDFGGFLKYEYVVIIRIPSSPSHFQLMHIAHTGPNNDMLALFLSASSLTTKYLYLQSTTVYVPSSEFGLPQPLFGKRVCLPP
jgi:hypothetical protein